jgi:hypothetical protein
MREIKATATAPINTPVVSIANILKNATYISQPTAPETAVYKISFLGALKRTAKAAAEIAENIKSFMKWKRDIQIPAL